MELRTVRAVAIVLLVLALVHCYRMSQAPFDGTFCVDAPSGLYAVETIHGTSIKDGDVSDSVEIGSIITEVGDRPWLDFDSLLHALSARPDTAVTLSAYSPFRGDNLVLKVTPDQLSAKSLTRVQPGVLVLSTAVDGTAPSDQLRRGDLIVAVDSKEFTGHYGGWDLGFWVILCMSRLQGKHQLRTAEIEHSVLRARIGDTLSYDIWRGGNQQTQPVGIIKFGFPAVVVANWGFYLLFILLGIFLLRREHGSNGFGFMLAVFAYLLIIFSYRRDAAFGVLEYLRDGLAWGLLVFAISLFVRAHLPKPRSIFFVSIIGAVVLWWVFFTIHEYSPLETVDMSFFTLSGLRVKLFERGPIPQVILGVFLAGMVHLLQIARARVGYMSVRRGADKRLWAAVQSLDVREIEEELNRPAHDDSPTYLAPRLKRLLIRHARDNEITTLTAIRDDILSEDEDQVAAAFVPVRWCEIALPVLGFLGTVVGIGMTVGDISKAVQIRLHDGSMEEAMVYFKSAFEGMSLAFETTFLGLAAALVITGITLLLKKLLASRLYIARLTYDGLIDSLMTESVTAKLSETASLLEKGNQQRNTVLEGVERVIAEHPGEQYDDLRNILFEPVVVCEDTVSDLSAQRAQFVSEKLGSEDWSYVGLGVPPNGSHLICANIAGNGGNALLLMSTRNAEELRLAKLERQLLQVVPAGDGRSFWGITADLRIIVGQLQGEGDELDGELRYSDQQLPPDYRLAAVSVKNKEIGVIGYQDEATASIDMVSIGGTADRQRLLETSRLFKWDTALWTVEPQSGVLYIGGKSHRSDRWCIQRIEIGELANLLERGGTPARTAEQVITMPLGMVPLQLVCTSKDKLLILDAEGWLHSWDVFSFGPRRLRDPRDKWRVDCQQKQRTLMAGSSGWLAHVAASKLTMWQIRYDSVVLPYEGPKHPFPVPSIRHDRFIVSTDKEHLLATHNHDKIIFMWRFPRFAVDVR